MRLLDPLTALAFAAIPVACLLTGEFNRRGQTRRVLLAIVLALAFEVLDLGLKNLAGRTSIALPFLYLNVMAPIWATVWLLWRDSRQPDARTPRAGELSGRHVALEDALPLHRPQVLRLVRRRVPGDADHRLPARLHRADPPRRRHGPKRRFWLLLEMAALKLPHMAQEIMPFAILFGTMMAFWRLTRSNELVVARAAGVSVWQFLTPAAGSARRWSASSR